MTPARAIVVGSGEPSLVFLHGIGCCGEGWRRQLDAFADSHQCIAWHAPGYGGRALPPHFDWSTLADDLAATLDEHRVGKAVLVGLSMGGMVAQHYLSRGDPRIVAAVLAATSAAFGSGDGDWQQRFLAQRLEPLDAGLSMRELAPTLVASMTTEHADPAGVAAAIECMGNVATDTYRAAMHNLVTFDGRADFARIAVPLLLLAGAADPVAPAAMMQRLAARNAHAVYEDLPKTGHLSSFEQPTRFNAALNRFLTGVSMQTLGPPPGAH